MHTYNLSLHKYAAKIINIYVFMHLNIKIKKQYYRNLSMRKEVFLQIKLFHGKCLFYFSSV